MCTPLAMNVTERSINSDKMMSFKHPEEISIRVTRPNSYKSAGLRLGNDRPPTHIASFTLQIQDRNMPFSSPSTCRPAITLYSSTILHTRDKLYQGQLNYKPVCLWSVDGNQSFRRKPTRSQGECTDSTHSIVLSRASGNVRQQFYGCTTLPPHSATGD